jgi:hypothetical protein
VKPPDQWLHPSELGSRDSIYFECGMREGGECLVLARNNLIIGSSWLALIPTSAVEKYLPKGEDDES